MCWHPSGLVIMLYSFRITLMYVRPRYALSCECPGHSLDDVTARLPPSIMILLYTQKTCGPPQLTIAVFLGKS